MDNPEKPTTCGTQDEDKQTKQKHNTIYVGVDFVSASEIKIHKVFSSFKKRK
jgi:hypothetical protein